MSISIFEMGLASFTQVSLSGRGRADARTGVGDGASLTTTQENP